MCLHCKEEIKNAFNFCRYCAEDFRETMKVCPECKIARNYDPAEEFCFFCPASIATKLVPVVDFEGGLYGDIDFLITCHSRHSHYRSIKRLKDHFHQIDLFIDYCEDCGAPWTLSPILARSSSHLTTTSA